MAEDGRAMDSKIVVLGSQGVGKTSIVVRYAKGTFTNSVTSTIGASFFTHKLSVDNTRLTLQIWDTAGQERFRSMAPMYYRGASAAILIYDVTNLDSYDALPGWIKELKRMSESQIVICVVGNKTDLRATTDPTISAERGAQFAADNGAFFFETSAKDNTGVADCFLKIARELVANRANAPAGPSRPVLPGLPPAQAQTKSCC